MTASKPRDQVIYLALRSQRDPEIIRLYLQGLPMQGIEAALGVSRGVISPNVRRLMAEGRLPSENLRLRGAALAVENTPDRCFMTAARPDLFWQKVDQSGGPDACWPWMMATHGGYGHCKFDLGDGCKTHVASRVAYSLAVGPIPEGLLICHHCDNPPCCNPHHLYAGTHQDNLRDAIDRGRRDPSISGRRRREPHAA